MGERMFPYPRKGYVTHRELFPNLDMPSFRIVLRIKRKTEQKWVLDYRCTCENEDSLQCLALASHFVAVWKECVLNFLNSVFDTDAWPPYVVRDFDLAKPWQGYEMWMKKFDPIACFHFIFNHRTVKDFYAVAREGGTYRVYMQTKYFNHNIKCCLETLATVKHKLPFKLEIECFPYYIFK